MKFKLESRNILIVSNEPWGDVWYSKQNYAFELSRKNNVIFINPPSRWTFSNLFNSKFKLTSIEGSLQKLEYGNFIPVRSALLESINNRTVSIRLKKWLKKNKIRNDIFWSFDPIRLYNHQLVGSEIGIFHCVDFYNFSYRGEKSLCENSDFIFANTPFFIEKYNAFETPKCLIPHAISEEEFDRNEIPLKKVSDELDKAGVCSQNMALYIGRIDNRIDLEITEKMICAFPQLDFVFIGAYYLPETEQANRIFKNGVYTNVFLLGPKPFKSLKYYIAFSRFCCLFMNMNHKGFTFQSHKILNYLAQGKPVFCSMLSEYQEFPNIFYLYKNEQDLLYKLTAFLNGGEVPSMIKERINFAAKFAFKNIFRDIEIFINKNEIKQ